MNRGALRPGAGGRLGGVLRLRVSGALPEAFLNECARRGVRTEQVEAEDEFTLALSVAARDAQAAEAAAARCGCTAERLRLRGAPAALRRLRRRLFLCLGALGAALLLFLSSLYIWDIEVTENDTAVPDGEILAALRQAGVDIGTFWPSLRGDMVRTRALLALPELSWLTVNVRGSRAEVLVRGAVVAPEIWEEKTAADVTAAKAGVITEIRVLEGEARASVGHNCSHM